MEPQMIDYYNEMPYGVNVIDKMNEELAEAQARIKQLELQLKKRINDFLYYLFKIIIISFK